MKNKKQIIIVFQLTLMTSKLYGETLYRVKPGDSLSTILYRLEMKPLYGNHGSILNTKALNNIKNENLIKTGDLIRIISKEIAPSQIKKIEPSIQNNCPIQEKPIADLKEKQIEIVKKEQSTRLDDPIRVETQKNISEKLKNHIETSLSGNQFNSTNSLSSSSGLLSEVSVSDRLIKPEGSYLEYKGEILSGYVNGSNNTLVLNNVSIGREFIYKIPLDLAVSYNETLNTNELGQTGGQLTKFGTLNGDVSGTFKLSGMKIIPGIRIPLSPISKNNNFNLMNYSLKTVFTNGIFFQLENEKIKGDDRDINMKKIGIGVGFDF